MERRDYLMREIEKLTAAIKRLIGLVEDMNSANFEESIQQINKELTNQFGFDLTDISTMTDADFLKTIETIDQQNLEFFTELLSEISKKVTFFKKEKDENTKELALKAILLLDYIDKTSKTFSLKRMTLKNDLQKTIATTN